MEKIISQMRLEDKIALCEGANFWETKSFPQYGIAGGIKGGVIPGMLEMANGHFFKGLWKMLTG